MSFKTIYLIEFCSNNFMPVSAHLMIRPYKATTKPKETNPIIIQIVKNSKNFKKFLPPEPGDPNVLNVF